MKKAYKIFDENLCCRGMQFTIGQTYSHKDRPIKLCQYGFHFCLNVSDLFNWYSFDLKNRVCEIEYNENNYIQSNEKDKCVTDEIKIIKEITWHEVLDIVNIGKNCTGLKNTGDWNTGDWNTGSRNTGSRNTGSRNTGNRNTGDWNTGSKNTGDWNTGSRNTGSRNTGNRNTGNRNTGNWNTGSRNTGNWNTGSRNTGNRNTGNWNTGDWNTGNWNTGSKNTGNLNTNFPDKFMVFNKWIKKEEYDNIIYPDFFYFDITIFVSYDMANEAERNKYKQEIEICGGFVKKIDYKEAFKLSWLNASKKDREKVKNIPGFDNNLFFEISGIDVEKDIDK